MGNKDEAKGRAKKAAGSLTDDSSLKNEGRVDQAVGKAKSAVDEVADIVKGAVNPGERDAGRSNDS